jgi:hypothetical protein
MTRLKLTRSTANVERLLLLDLINNVDLSLSHPSSCESWRNVIQCTRKDVESCAVHTHTLLSFCAPSSQPVGRKGRRIGPMPDI